MSDGSLKKKLGSGVELEVTPADWQTSKRLYQVLADEAKALKLNLSDEADFNFFKDIFLSALASQKVEDAVWACIDGRCTYDKIRITKDTFEPVKAREDYIEVCFEVAGVNIRPFTRSLFARFREFQLKLSGILGLNAQTEKKATS